MRWSAERWMAETVDMDGTATDEVLWGHAAGARKRGGSRSMGAA